MMVCLMMSSSSKRNLCPSSNWKNCRICLPRQARDRPQTGPGGWLICTRTPSLDRGWYYCVDHNDFTSYTHGRNPTEDSSYLNFPSSIPEEVCATSLRNATSIFTCQLSGRLVMKYKCLFFNGQSCTHSTLPRKRPGLQVRWAQQKGPRAMPCPPLI